MSSTKHIYSSAHYRSEQDDNILSRDFNPKENSLLRSTVPFPSEMFGGCR